MNRKDKYKRKFIVLGDTPKKEICDECIITANYTYYALAHPCSNTNQIEPNNCIKPDDAFKKYLVSETIDGKWVCSCPRGKFHRVNGESICHHVDKAKQNPDKYEVTKSVTVNKMKIAEEL